MTLATAFSDLNRVLYSLRDAFQSLHITLVEDKPLRDDVVISDLLGDVATELLGLATTAQGIAADVRPLAERRQNLSEIRRRLALCHQLLNQMQVHFFELLAYERFGALRKLGQERGGEWQAWVEAVTDAVEQCHPLLHESHQLLLCSWQTISEWAEQGHTSVQTTVVGQLNAPLPRRRDDSQASVRQRGLYE